MPKTIGLDLGTSTMIVAQDSGFTKMRNCFFDVEASPIVKQTLATLKIDYIEDTAQEKVILVGDSALSVSNMFGRVVRRTMKDGLLSRSDAEALPMMKQLIKMLLANAGVSTDDKIKFTIPADPVNSELSREYHKAVIEHILTDLGYTNFSAINEGLCVNYALLKDHQYSGIAASFGSGQINFSIAQFGIEAFSFSVVGGGDTIDSKVAQSVGGKLTPSKVTIIKESGIDISAPADTVQEAISVYYKAMIRTCLKLTLDKMATLEGLTLRENIPFALAGGSVQVKGFEKIFREVLDELAPSYKFTYGDLIIAEDAQNQISKGALEAAKLS